MESRTIFEDTNPNNKIFVVGGERGSDSLVETDNRHSMIGDAVMKHQSSLSAIDRLMYHELLCFADGSIVAMEDNLVQNIPNFREMDEEEATAFLESKGVFLDESEEDIYAMGIRTSISLEEYEKNIEPKEIPATPRPKFRYCGNTRQVFYDQFPEDHPEADKINMTLMMLKNNISTFLDEYVHIREAEGRSFFEYHWFASWGHYFQNLIEMWHKNGEISHVVATAMTRTIGFITHKNPDEADIRDFIAARLLEIDEDYSAEVMFIAECNSLKTNEAYAFIAKKEMEWDKMYEADARNSNLLTIYRDIGRAGMEMFSSEFNKGEEGITVARKMKLAWSKYRGIKRKFAPRLVFEGVNLNRCYNSTTLRTAVGFTKEQADAIVSRLFEKEFKSLNEVFSVAGVSQKLFRTSSHRNKASEIFNIIDEGFDKAVKYNNINKLLSVAPNLIKKREAGELTKDFKVWQDSWEHYRDQKAKATKELAA